MLQNCLRNALVEELVGSFLFGNVVKYAHVNIAMLALTSLEGRLPHLKRTQFKED